MHNKVLYGSNSWYCNILRGGLVSHHQASGKMLKYAKGGVRDPLRRDDAPTRKEIQAANEVFTLTNIQRITGRGKAKQLVAFCDPGSYIHLVRRALAEEAGWRGTLVRQPITMVFH